MKKIYTVLGMTCNGCKSTVYEKLNKLQKIKSVEVDLENAEATIFMTGNIKLFELQKALPSKLQIL